MRSPEPAPAAIVAVALLSDPLRARLHRLVRERGAPVTRDEAAAATGISRKLAAFHLDKLVDAGLLRARYRPPAGRPRRAGRTPKAYEPSDLELRVTIPERRYELLGEILVEALTARDAPREAALRVAAARGEALGARARADGRLGRLGPERALTVATDVLADLGFEPHRHPGGVTLRNCPFRTLAQQAPELVCAVNHAVIAGLLRGLGSPAVEAVLAPTPDACCVELHAS